MNHLSPPLLIEHELSYPLDIGTVLELDTNEEGETASIHGFQQKQSLEINGWFFDLPAGWTQPEFPHLRFLNSHQMLLLDTHPEAAEGNNAWILSREAEVMQNWNLGSGIVDVIPTWNGFTVLYNGAAALAHEFPAHNLLFEGLAVFDSRARQLWSFNTEFSEQGFRIENIFVGTRYSAAEVLVIPDRLHTPLGVFQFPVVIVHTTERTLKWYESPFREPLAVATGADPHEIFVYSPLFSPSEIYHWHLETQKTELVTTHPDIYRGTYKGRFLAQVDDTRYLVLNPQSLLLHFDENTVKKELFVPRKN